MIKIDSKKVMGNKIKSTITFSPEFVKEMSLENCRRVKFQCVTSDTVLVTPIRTRNNRERTNNIKHPHGAFSQFTLKK